MQGINSTNVSTNLPTEKDDLTDDLTNAVSELLQKVLQEREDNNSSKGQRRSSLYGSIPNTSRNNSKKGSFEDASHVQFQLYFEKPDVPLNKKIQSIRSPVHCIGIPVYALRLGNDLIDTCVKKIDALDASAVFSILLNNKEYSPEDTENSKGILRKLCAEKRGPYNRTAFVNALIQYLPLEDVAKAKVGASFFTLFCRFTKCISPDRVIKGPPEQYSIETVQDWVAFHSEDLSQIEHLNLAYSYIEVFPDEIFCYLTDLKTLDFSYNNASSEIVLKSLQQLSNLEELNLNGNCFRRIPEDFFTHFPSLKKIDLRNNFFSSRGSEPHTKLLY